MGLFRLVFGLRYVADQAAAQGATVPAVLRALLYLCVLLFRGPLLALFTLGSVYCLLFGLARVLRAWDWRVNWTSGSGAVATFAVVGCACLAGGLGHLWREWRRHLRFGGFAFWLAVAGLVAVALALGTDFPPEARFFGYLNRLHDKYLERLDSAAFYIAVILWITDWVRDAAFVLLAAALSVLIVGLFLSKPEDRPGLVIAYLAGVLQSTLWLLLLSPLDFALVWGLDAVEPRLPADVFNNDLFAAFIYAMMFRLFLVYSLLIPALASLAARLVWSRLNSAATWPRSSPPRLIVAMLIQVVLMLISMVHFETALYGATSELRGSRGQAERPGLEWFLRIIDREVGDVVEAVWLPAFAVTVLVAVVFLVRDQLPRNVLHIVMDIVIHFSRPWENFPIRRRIEARFREVFGKLLDEVQPTHVTILRIVREPSSP